MTNVQVCTINVKRKSRFNQQTWGRVIQYILTEKLCLRPHALSYGLNVCLLPNAFVEIHTPKVMV